MPLTSSDLNRRMYVKLRDQGLSHKKALKRVPKKLRKQFEKTPIESHYGMKDSSFLKLTLGLAIGSILFLSYLITTFNQ